MPPSAHSTSPTSTKGKHYPESDSIDCFAYFFTSHKCSHTICALCVLYLFQIFSVFLKNDIGKDDYGVPYVLILLILFPSPKATTYPKCDMYSIHVFLCLHMCITLVLDVFCFGLNKWFHNVRKFGHLLVSQSMLSTPHNRLCDSFPF